MVCKSPGQHVIPLTKDRNNLIKPDRKAFDLSLLKRRDVLLLIGWASSVRLDKNHPLLPDNVISVSLTTHRGAIVVLWPT
jgi:hypothetical protein